MKTIMKSINKFLLAFSTVCLTLFGTSCTEEIEYSQAEKLNGAQVHFSSETPSQIDLDKDKTSYLLQIMRANTTGELTVELKVESETDKLSIPTSVKFADGENTANIEITYSLEELGYDNYSNVNISLADGDYSTPYGPSSLALSIGIPAPWTSLGKATFVEDFMTTFFTVDNVPYEVEIQESDLYKGVYRLVNPFGEAYPYNEDGDWDTSKDYYLEINASDPEGVYITMQESGMDWGYGRFTFGSYAGYFIENGATIEEVKEAGYAGTLKDGIITFPTRSLLISMANYQNGGIFEANLNGAFKIALPGVELTDYAINVSYEGNQVNASGAVEGVIAKINSIGDDVENVNLAVIPGNGADIDTTAVLSNSMEVNTANMELPASIVVPAELKESNFYTLVAMALANDTVRTISTSTFRYNLSEETWTEKYVGTYKFNNPAIIKMTEVEKEENLVISQSNNNPMKWRVTGSKLFDNFEFMYNETNNQASVLENTLLQGQLYIANQKEDGTIVYGKKEDNKFIFNVNYFTSGSDLGNCTEELLITGTINQNLNTYTATKKVRTFKLSSKRAF